MPSSSSTIRILVSTDNHVGYEERDPIRKDDGWRTFDEIMTLARTSDVDMVLLGGDLFHDNKPSRATMYQVMRSLRKNCLGDRPCELEFLSDPNTVFKGAFPFVNYEDPDINISLPVFSIHGNHDDPSGEGHLCALDLLQCAGLVNYYGRISEADRIDAKPVLLQKGETRLALYGLSNVRDERMFRTFRDGHVRWFRPSGGRNEVHNNNNNNISSSSHYHTVPATAEAGDGPPWFNLLAVHQNHHAHTATSYLPENVLPDWLHLVVWGHEHECLIDPTRNPETGFYVMQPGSSIATSLAPGEAVAKHVAIVSITGTDFRVEKIPLQTVRPMAVRDLVLAKDERFAKLSSKQDNRNELVKRLEAVVDEMIDEARTGWVNLHQGRKLEECPLPLIRLRVEYTAPEGRSFDIENPQRFSSRFVGRAANTSNIVYFFKKKTTAPRAVAVDMPEMADRALGEEIQVEELVHDFLAAQSLKLFPQAPLGDAVSTYVTKDDRHTMDMFVKDSLSSQVKQMLALGQPEGGELDVASAMEKYKAQQEAKFLEEQARRGKATAAAVRVGEASAGRLKPKPVDWDSDLDGHWEDHPEAQLAPGAVGFARAVAAAKEDAMGVDEDEGSDEPVPPKRSGRDNARASPPARGKSRTSKAPATKSAAVRKSPAASRTRNKGLLVDSEDSDVEVLESNDDDDDDDDDEEEEPESRRTRTRAPARAPAAATSTRGTTTSRRGRGGKTTQTTLNFSQASMTTATRASARRSQTQARKTPELVEIEDDEIEDDDDDNDDDDDDPFESAPKMTKNRSR